MGKVPDVDQKKSVCFVFPQRPCLLCSFFPCLPEKPGFCVRAKVVIPIFLVNCKSKMEVSFFRKLLLNIHKHFKAYSLIVLNKFTILLT